MKAEDAKIKTKEKRIEIINSHPQLREQLNLILDEIQKQVEQGLSFLNYKIRFIDQRITHHLRHDLGYTVHDNFDYPELFISWYE